MSAIGEAMRAVKEALLLADAVERASAQLRDIAAELREHDRRLTRLEAQWDTALALSQRGGTAAKRIG